MLIGYARVSTDDQNPDHQIDALLRAGVARENIHVDYASGAKASIVLTDLPFQCATSSPANQTSLGPVPEIDKMRWGRSSHFHGTSDPSG